MVCHIILIIIWPWESTSILHWVHLCEISAWRVQNCRFEEKLHFEGVEEVMIAILCWMTSNTSVCFFTTWHQLSLSCWIIKLCLPFFFFCSNYYFLKFFVCLLVTVNACNLRIKSVSSLSFQVLQNLCFKNHTMNSWKKHLSQMDYYAAKVLNTYRFFFNIFSGRLTVCWRTCALSLSHLYTMYTKNIYP